ncbi:MAG: HD domain-containing protein [Candidatus Saccharimonas sp.]
MVSNFANIVEQAKSFAIERHGDQRYGDNLPYEWHIGSVASLAARLGYSDQIQAAAWLHDTVEDTGTTLGEIEERFGNKIAVIVDGVTYTESDKQAGVDKIQKAAQNVGSHVVKFCDASVNFSASTLHGAPGKMSQWYATVNRYGKFIARLQPELPTPKIVERWLADN